MKALSYKAICLVLICMLLCVLAGCMTENTCSPEEEASCPEAVERNPDEADTAAPENEDPPCEEDPVPAEDTEDGVNSV